MATADGNLERTLPSDKKGSSGSENETPPKPQAVVLGSSIHTHTLTPKQKKLCRKRQTATLNVDLASKLLPEHKAAFSPQEITACGDVVREKGTPQNRSHHNQNT